MATKKTYTVPEVPGSKRQSARPYTHAVIGFFDAERYVSTRLAERKAHSARDRRYAVENYESWARAAKAAVGELYLNHNGYRVPAKDYEIDIARGFITQNPTIDAYLARLQAEFEAEIAKVREEGNGPLTVLRWSQSAANAQKALREFDHSYSGLRVVSCVPVTN